MKSWRHASKTTNNYAPEGREHAVQMLLYHERNNTPRLVAVASIAARIGSVTQTLHELVKKEEADNDRRVDRGRSIADGSWTREP